MIADQEMKCSVCLTDENIVGTASSPVGPVSHVYCKTCLLKGAVPECDLIYLYEDVAEGDESTLAPWVVHLTTYKDGEYIKWEQWMAKRKLGDEQTT